MNLSKPALSAALEGGIELKLNTPPALRSCSKITIPKSYLSFCKIAPRFRIIRVSIIYVIPTTWSPTYRMSMFTRM